MPIRLLVPPSVGVARARARAELLESSLSAELGEHVRVDVAPDYASIERIAREGGADLVWAPAATCAHIEHLARAIFKCVRGGRSTYRSAMVARSSAHLSLQGLAGTRAAWVDPLSLGGHLLVVNHLRERGIEPDRTFASQEFLGTHPAVLAAVVEGRADIAAVSVASGDSEHIEQAIALHGGRSGAQQLVALAITDTAPTDALLIARSLDESVASALIARLASGSSARTTALRLAMESEGFEVARPGEYAVLAKLLRPV